MEKYIELAVDELQEENIVVYGTGNFGRRCLNKLAQDGITPCRCSDSDKEKWGKRLNGVEIIAPERIKTISNLVVIIAIEQFKDAYDFLKKMNLEKIAIFYSQRVFIVEKTEALKIGNPEDVEKNLLEKNIILYGNKKCIMDAQYLFEFLKEATCIEQGDSIPRQSDESVLIVCERCTDNTKEVFNYFGYRAEENLIFLEDIFPLLDCDSRIIGKIPSVMAFETVFDSMKEQYKCKQPFDRMQLSSDFSVHCCCGDWADSWGNLKYNSMEEIWNSNIAKIFRLSIINRTYTFCRKGRCVHMVTNPKTTSERISPQYQTTEIPEYIEVGIDKTCNLFCKSCRDCVIVETGDKKKQIEDISQKIKESGWLNQTKMLLLGGQGEVFVSPVYQSLMYDGSGKRKTLDLRTNATAFSEEDLEKLIEKYEHLRIIVSIDAATEDTYNRLRRSNSKDTYNMLLKNMKLLSAMRKDKKIDFLQINMCVQMGNYTEIPDFVTYGDSLGCDVIYLTPIRNWGTYSEEEFRNVGIFASGKEVKPAVKAVIEKVQNNKHVQMAF